MRKSLLFLAFFCAIVVIDGNFIQDVFRRKADLAAQLQQAQQSGQQGQQGGQQDDQDDQGGQDQGDQQQSQGQQQGQGQQGGPQLEPIDCFKFNSDSHLELGRSCRLTTTVLKNDTHWAYCDSGLLQLPNGTQQASPTQGQGSPVQGQGQLFARPLQSCKVDPKGTLTCQVVQGSTTPQNNSGVQVNVTQNGVQAGISGSLFDIINKTFTGCFLYPKDEIDKQDFASQGQGFEDDEIVEYVCVRRKPNQQTIGLAGQQAQQQQQQQQQQQAQQQQQPPPPGSTEQQAQQQQKAQQQKQEKDAKDAKEQQDKESRDAKPDSKEEQIDKKGNNDIKGPA